MIDDYIKVNQIVLREIYTLAHIWIALSVILYITPFTFVISIGTIIFFIVCLEVKGILLFILWAPSVDFLEKLKNVVFVPLLMADSILSSIFIANSFTPVHTTNKKYYFNIVLKKKVYLNTGLLLLTTLITYTTGLYSKKSFLMGNYLAKQKSFFNWTICTFLIGTSFWLLEVLTAYTSYPYEIDVNLLCHELDNGTIWQNTLHSSSIFSYMIPSYIIYMVIIGYSFFHIHMQLEDCIRRSQESTSDDRTENTITVTPPPIKSQLSKIVILFFAIIFPNIISAILITTYLSHFTCSNDEILLLSKDALFYFMTGGLLISIANITSFFAGKYSMNDWSNHQVSPITEPMNKITHSKTSNEYKKVNDTEKSISNNNDERSKDDVETDESSDKSHFISRRSKRTPEQEERRRQMIDRARRQETTFRERGDPFADRDYHSDLSRRETYAHSRNSSCASVNIDIDVPIN